MSYEVALDANLAAALGDDLALLDELRGAFLESATRHFDALRGADGADGWADAALRLKSLAASFGDDALMAAADAAMAASPGDPAVLAAIAARLAVIAL